MNEPTTYKLKYPIEIRDKDSGAVTETITEFTIKRPKGKQLRATDRAEGDVARSLALIAAVSDQPPSIMELLDAEDFVALGDIVGDFFGARQKAGAMSTAI